MYRKRYLDFYSLNELNQASLDEDFFSHALGEDGFASLMHVGKLDGGENDEVLQKQTNRP